MEIIAEKILASGEKLTVVHWAAPEKAPRKYLDYIIASFGSDHPRDSFFGQSGWRSYLRDGMEGVAWPEVVDHWFIAEIDGECAGRIWFAYSPKSKRGNFGNVLTEPQFRKRGIMSELLAPCMEEFRRSPAKMLCCSSGNPYAVASYLKAGFKLIFGGQTGPLCIIKEGSFQEEAHRAFDGGKVVAIRPGTRGDQFDCDKFLAYVDCVKNHPFPFRCGPSSLISEYRLAIQEKLAGRGVVNVAENDRGETVAYAFAAMAEGTPLVDFTCHPAYIGEVAGLVKRSVTEFKELFSMPLMFFGFSDDAAKLEVIRSCGAVRCGVFPGAIPRRGSFADMEGWLFR